MATAAQKKAAAKKAKNITEDSTESNTGLGVPQIVKTAEVEFRSRASGSKYDPIVDLALGLKHGQTLKIPMADGEDAVAIRNRLGAVIRRKVTPVIEENGGKVRLRVTQDNHIAICVEKA